MKTKIWLKAVWRYEVWLWRSLAIIIIISGIFYFPKIKNFFQNNYLSGIEYLYNASNDQPSDEDLEIDSKEDKVILDKTLKKIFPNGWANISPEKQAIEIARYVALMKNENNTGTATKIIQDGYAICGGKSLVFRTLTRKIGLPSRYIAAFNMPTQGGHNMTEVFYNNDWHLFDPTFGVFVYSKKEYDGTGRILSTPEVDKGENFLMKIVDKPWTGEYSQAVTSFKIIPVDNEYFKESYGWFQDGFNVYWRNEFSKAYPIAYGTVNWVSMPVDFDLEKNNHQILGKVDKQSSDLASSEGFTGWTYLGKNVSVPGIYDTFTIKSQPGKIVILKLYLLNKPYENQIINLRGVEIIEKNTSENQIEIKLKIKESPGIFLLVMPIGAVEVDAIEASI